MKNNWKKTTLKEITEKVIDNRGKTPPVIDNGYEILEVNSISQDKRDPDYSKVTKFVDKYIYNSWFRNGHVKENDILIPTVGTIGNVSFSKQNRGSIAQNLIALRVKKEYNPLFIYYKLKSPVFKKQILNLDIGGVQPSVKVPHLLAQEILLPPFKEQKEIADILSSLDDKIELLREQNKTLETTAQTIFKEWFIKEGTIPKDWKSSVLCDFVDVISGYSYKGKELKTKSKYGLVTLKSFDRNGGFQTRGFKPFKGSPKENQEVIVGDLVVAHTDLTQDAEVLGNPAFIFDNGGFKKMYITMDLMKVVSKKKEIKNSFLYFLMKTHQFKKHCVGFSNGTTVLHMSRKAIPSYEIFLPKDLRSVENFSIFADKIMKKIILNNAQIQSLSKTRDILLPKLMSGEIGVNF